MSLSIGEPRYAGLSPTEHDYEDFFENGAVGLHLVGSDGIILRANRAELEMLGYAADEYVGRPITDFHVDAEVIADILRRLSAGERLDKYPARLRARDGSIRHVLISSSALFRDGKFVNTRCFSIDVTEAKLAEQRSAESEARSRELLEALPIGVYTTDAEGRITYYNQAAAALAGRHPELGVDRWCVTWRLRWPDGAPMPHDECPMAVALKDHRELRGVHAIAERPDGSRRAFMPHPTLLRNSQGQIVGAMNALVDVTALHEAERAQRLLIDELNHRVKNTLATVQSISLHTHRSTPDTFVEKFEGRLLALSKTHNLLARRRWTGVQVLDLLREEFAPYADGPDVVLSGPSVMLSARAGLALGMTLHELATNAAKYGALAVEGGQVEVSWSREARDDGSEWFALQWTERGGPPVTPPTRAGFGRRLIDGTIVRDLRGRADMTFERAGLRCALAFPLESAESAQDEPQEPIRAKRARPGLLAPSAGLPA